MTGKYLIERLKQELELFDCVKTRKTIVRINYLIGLEEKSYIQINGFTFMELKFGGREYGIPYKKSKIKNRNENV